MDEIRNPGNRALWAVYGVLIAAWTLYAYGSFWRRPVGSLPSMILLLSPLLLLGLTASAWQRRERWWPWLIEQLEHHTEAIDQLPIRRIGIWVAVAAGVGLYLELMIIRLHSSYFQLFAYFKNVSLLSCFLGLGIGYTLGGKRLLLTPLVLPSLAAQVLFMHALRVNGTATMLQSPVTEELSFQTGTDTLHPIATYGFLILIFAFNALCFIPLGQLASRLMARIPKLVAYSWNLVGSLAGIFLFTLLSYRWAPPTVWLLLGSAAVAAFVWRQPVSLATSMGAALVAIAVVSVPVAPNELDVYSPYQQISLMVHRAVPPELRVNHVYHQRVLALDSASVSIDRRLAKWQQHYDLPYHFQPAPGRVLVVGAGTGNDVAAAIRARAGHVDAVEIDPAILQFGRLLHPEAPYQKPNVTAFVEDARAFIRHARAKYDLIVYGLLDSHTLLSGKAGVRLDSYVYTVDAFREARTRLAPGGLISLTFSLIRPELGQKLYLMLEEAFDGQTPLVYRTGYDGGFTFLIGDAMADRSFPVYEGLQDVTDAFARGDAVVDLSTDDWPFLYMPNRTYPSSYVIMILVLLAVSLVFIRQLVPGSGQGMSGPCFFLGAGFMLIETKGITELALVYGSTWFVIAVVIVGILIMAFLANLFVLRWGSPPPPVTYGLLLVSIVAGLSLTSARLAALPPTVSGLILTAGLTVPLFFSGFAFSTELKKAPSVAVALSSNLLGAMLGGFLEYNSMYFGFRSLYFMAFAMYALAFLGSVRTVRAPERAATPVPSSA